MLQYYFTSGKCFIGCSSDGNSWPRPRFPLTPSSSRLSIAAAHITIHCGQWARHDFPTCSPYVPPYPSPCSIMRLSIQLSLRDPSEPGENHDRRCSARVRTMAFQDTCFSVERGVTPVATGAFRVVAVGSHVPYRRLLRPVSCGQTLTLRCDRCSPCI